MNRQCEINEKILQILKKYNKVCNVCNTREFELVAEEYDLMEKNTARGALMKIVVCKNCGNTLVFMPRQDWFKEYPETP